MKKYLILLLIPLFAGIIVWRGNRTDQQQVLTPQPSTVASYTLVALNSSVSMKLPTDTDFRIVSGQHVIVEGTEIKTNSTGKAKLLYPNGTITSIEPDTHLKIEDLDAEGNKSRLELVGGSIWSKVTRLLGQGEYYEVQTETTVASVRGTIFTTTLRNKKTSVLGIEGTIRAKVKDPVKRTVIEESAVDITSGEKTEVTTDEVAKGLRTLKRQVFADQDLRSTIVKEALANVTATEARELRRKEQQERFEQLIERVKERNTQDPTFIQRLRENELIKPTPSPTPEKTVRPSPLTTPTVQQTPVLTSPKPTPTEIQVSPSPIVSPKESPITQASPTPTPVRPIATSITPRTAKAGDAIIVNGEGFQFDRKNQITAGTIGQRSVVVGIVDQQSLFLDIPTDLTAGVYDISLTTLSGEKLILLQVLTVQ